MILFSEFYETKEIPPKEYFCSLKDSPAQILEKEEFFRKAKNFSWNFMDQMKSYIFFQGKHILNASLKLIDICHEIQILLQQNYSGKEMPIRSPFSVANCGSFIYHLIVHYAMVDLDRPIYSPKFSEKGVYDSNCSQPEFIFQYFFKHLRKDNDLQASYLSPLGGAKFGFISPDIFDKTKGTVFP